MNSLEVQSVKEIAFGMEEVNFTYNGIHGKATVKNWSCNNLVISALEMSGSYSVAQFVDLLNELDGLSYDIGNDMKSKYAEENDEDKFNFHAEEN